MMRGNGNLFSAKVIATNKVYYDDRLRYLNVRTLDGQIGFMAHHAPVVVAVDIGVLDMQKPDGSWEHVEELRQKQSYQEFKKSQAALARALGRLEFYKKTYM